jgi:hypothetical protein
MVNPRGLTASSLFFMFSRNTYVTLAVVLCLQLRSRPLVVVIEGEWRTVEILSAQSPINPLLMT